MERVRLRVASIFQIAAAFGKFHLLKKQHSLIDNHLAFIYFHFLSLLSPQQFLWKGESPIAIFAVRSSLEKRVVTAILLPAFSPSQKFPENIVGLLISPLLLSSRNIKDIFLARLSFARRGVMRWGVLTRVDVRIESLLELYKAWLLFFNLPSFFEKWSWTASVIIWEVWRKQGNQHPSISSPINLDGLAQGFTKFGTENHGPIWRKCLGLTLKKRIVVQSLRWCTDWLCRWCVRGWLGSHNTKSRLSSLL